MTILEQIQPILGSILGVAPEEVSLETTRNQLANWDSWAHLDLVMEIEAKFGCSLTMEETAGVKSVHDLVVIISSKTSQGGCRVQA